ncbi:hemagglutinin repeat-containing protein [Dyella caseinilytica]|uniref:Hemagglutinin repeat-containing protein n=1 Tax=Dyella caseinilytica TaxID=1849581 RepID=A0ABX7GVJ0_9GAMM|nr:hemagglutinin repeat-containing protein [Dyella caseinilytica]QRN54315.1 hemagglutinin repeat-containing protein [Dyella caseinilytica]GFZ93225.1 hypothetical protein GCM10011408_11160 [Dyella caseinilytica]
MAFRRHLSVSGASLSRRALSAAVLSALLGTPVLATAQVTPDPNASVHRPGTNAAGNGVPVVNIVAPSAAGVSHNQYQQFNVDKQGLILNNSAGVSQTQLGGYIVGNPNYQAGQSAKLIVNEVTSTNPTYLRGYTEVAGNAADVIIANPNGISVDGAGFINTNRATLTTGTPTFGADGSLSGLRTSGGAISVDGDGMDASNIDRLDLISRSLTVNGKVWANNLNVVTGANQVGYSDLSMQAIAGTGDTPTVSIDVASLGGMYANAAHLIASEAGVGVRNAGQLASQGGDFTIDAVGQLQLTGATSSAANLTISGASLSNSGTLQSNGAMSVQATAGVDNSGTLYSGDALSMQADSLSNSGALQSTADMSLRSARGITNIGTIYSGGNLALNAGDTLINSNVIAAASNTSMRARQLASSGTLGAGVASDGSLQGNSTLSISTTDALAANGVNLASGAITIVGSALDLSGAQTRAGGDVSLTSTAGDIDHANASLVTSGTLTIRSAGTVDNTNGAMQVGQLDAQAANWRNAYGSVMQTGNGPMSVRIGGLLDNTHGIWVANANTMALSADTIDNTGGAIEQAGTGTLTLSASALTNDQGQILGNGDLVLASQVVSNQAGALSVAGSATLAGGDLDNTDGTIVAQNLQAQLAGTLSNQGGLLLAGSAQLVTNTLNNDSGQIKAIDGNLDITAQTLSNNAAGFLGSNSAVALSVNTVNNAGQIYAGIDLTLTAQGGVTNSGALQAQGNVNVGIGGAFTNDNGQLEAGAGQGQAQLALNAAAISNQGGRIANADGGTTTINGGTLDNTGGTLGGNGDVTLNVAQITNNAGTLVSAGYLALQSSDLSNRNGKLYSAGNLAWNNSEATLDNTGGSIGSGGDIALMLDVVHNDGGNIASNNNVIAQFSGFDGAGGLRAGNNLTLALAGDYTNQVGNSLFANNDFTFNLGGAFTNAAGATLQTVGALTLNAASLDNQAGADINSANTTLNAGTQTNEGRIEGDTITLNAGDVTNTGTVIGNAITVNANNLINGADLGTATDNNPYQSALIAAVNQLNLYITGDLLNRDAMLYTLGDLTIAADASGARSNSVTNLSGDMEAGGNIAISTQQFTNQRRVFETEVYNLSAAEQAQNTTTLDPLPIYRYDDPNPLHHPPYVDASQILSPAQVAALEGYCGTLGTPGKDGDTWCNGVTMPGQSDVHNILHNDLRAIVTETLVSVERLKAASAESRVLAGGNITLNGSVLNDKSTIAAGTNLIINGQDGNAGGGNAGADAVENIAWTPTGTVQETFKQQTGIDFVNFNPDRHGDFLGYQTWGTYQDTASLGLGAGQPSWITFNAGPGLSATMSAGQAVDITGTTIDNNVVGSDGKPVAGVSLGSNGGSQTLRGQVGGGAQTIGDGTNPLGPIQLPSNGLYSIHPGSGSPYLVETDPRFASYTGFLGSDYLLNQLGLDGDLTLKRLGDAFYETQLVMDQITSLTGRRYLSNDTDALDQYKALMDAGAQEAQQFNLAVGVALTPEQMASLTQDMVWLVNETVDGEQVLVPVVYLSQQTANNVASGAVIQGNTVTLNASSNLTNTGTIAANQDASIKANNLLNAGTLNAGGNLSVQAAQDLLNVGSIQGGNVALVAGNNISSNAGASGVSLGNVDVNLSDLSLNQAQRLGVATAGAISATGNPTAQAGNNLTLDHATVSAGQSLGLAAGNDLNATAGQIHAGNDVQLIAGNNINLNAQGSTNQQGTQRNGVETTTYAVTTVQAGGNLVAVAGNDLTSQGAQLSAGDQIALAAGHDINLNAVTDERAQNTMGYVGKTFVSTSQTDQTLRGTSIDAANGVAISAGHDLTTVAAGVTSANGGIALTAGNDVNLNAGNERHTASRDTVTKSGGFLSSTTTDTHDAVQDNYAVGTLLSGNTVTVAAGHDINTRAAQIVATDDIVMAAGNDLNIGTATSTHSEQHDTTTKTNGVFTSGLNLMIGTSKTTHSYTETDTTPQGSLIGSLNGSVTLTAGNTVHITGSDVISQTGTAIVGKNVTIDAAVGTQDISQTYKQQQSGLTLGLGGAVADAINSAYASAQRGSQVQDSRLQALYAAQAAYSASDALGFAQDGLLNGATQGTPKSQQGVTLQIGLGGSSASSTTTTHDDTTYGSTIRSAGDVTIAATGGDLNLIGSQVAGQNVTLAAADNLSLLSQQENHTLQSSNKNASGGVGLQIGSDGVGFYAQASVGQGSAHGNGTSHAISTVDANGTLTLISGNDTTLKGAQLTGDTVLAAIGGNLLIQSEQDTDDYASKQQQLGAKVVIGYGSGGSVSYYQSKVNSHYQSVTDVSGISAGSGGFDITVGGNTHLIGGVIASAADPGKNVLDTGSLTFESLHNEANYSASGIGVSAGYGSGGFSGSPMLGVPQKGNSSSETNAGIAQGTIIVRDNPNQDLSGLDRTPTLDNQALAPIFNAQKVQENMELGQVAGQVGMRAAGDLAGQMGWAEGSAERTILHGVVGAGIAALGGGDALSGALGAAANQLVVQQMASYLQSQGYEPGTPEFATMLKLASTAVGAAVGGGTGAATALDGTTYNYLTHQQMDAFKKALKSCGTQDECQHVVDTYMALSGQNDEALKQACAAAPLGGACQDGIRDALSYANTPVNSYPIPAYASMIGNVIDDVNQSRGNVLNIVMTNQPAYGAINTIDARADFFGSMYQQTSAPWFGAAAETSTEDLMGVKFNTGNFVTVGGLADWRSQAGNLIMQNGYSSFVNVYQNYQNPSFDLNVWSLSQLVNEQNILQPVYDGQGGFTHFTIWAGGWLDHWIDATDVNQRIEFGCDRMGRFGYQGGCQ